MKLDDRSMFLIGIPLGVAMDLQSIREFLANTLESQKEELPTSVKISDNSNESLNFDGSFLLNASDDVFNAVIDDAESTEEVSTQLEAVLEAGNVIKEDAAKKLKIPAFCRCTSIVKKEIEDMKIDGDLILSWLTEYDENVTKAERRIVPHLTSNKPLDNSQKNKICNALVNKMIDIGKSKSWHKAFYYPPHCLKLAVAVQLTKNFPLTQGIRKKYAEVDKSLLQGHELYYDGADGMFETRLKTITRGLDDSEKKYLQKKSNDLTFNILPDMDEEEKYGQRIDYAMTLKPDAQNAKLIFEIMEETRSLRCAKVFDKEKWQTDTILKQFPHLLSYEGKLLEDEFMFLYPHAKSLKTKLINFICPKIKNFVKNSKLYQDLEECLKILEGSFIVPESDSRADQEKRNHVKESLRCIDDENVLRISIFVSVLAPEWKLVEIKGLEPPVALDSDANSSKRRKMGKQTLKPVKAKRSNSTKVNVRVIPNSKMLKFIAVGTDLKQTAARDPCKNLPTIICQTHNGKPAKYYLRFHKKLMDFNISKKDVFIDLFCAYVYSYILFDLEYPKELNQLFGFLRECVLEIDKPKKENAELYLKLLREPSETISENSEIEESGFENGEAPEDAMDPMDIE